MAPLHTHSTDLQKETDYPIIRFALGAHERNPIGRISSPPWFVFVSRSRTGEKMQRARCGGGRTGAGMNAEKYRRPASHRVRRPPPRVRVLVRPSERVRPWH